MPENDFWVTSAMDAKAYKSAYTTCDSVVSILESAVKNDSILINQANKVIESKVRASNFFESERNFERNKNVELQGKIAKVEQQNKFWRTFAGCAVAVVIYEFMKNRGL